MRAPLAVCLATCVCTMASKTDILAFFKKIKFNVGPEPDAFLAKCVALCEANEVRASRARARGGTSGAFPDCARSGTYVLWRARMLEALLAKA